MGDNLSSLIVLMRVYHIVDQINQKFREENRHTAHEATTNGKQQVPGNKKSYETSVFKSVCLGIVEMKEKRMLLLGEKGFVARDANRHLARLDLCLTFILKVLWFEVLPIQSCL